MTGPASPSVLLMVLRSSGSAVNTSSSRRAATATRWASTTSDVAERASRRPTAGPSSNGCTVKVLTIAARRACREPSRQTCARTGCVVCNEESGPRVAGRTCAASSPRSTEIKTPASRITGCSAQPFRRQQPHRAARFLGLTPRESRRAPPGDLDRPRDDTTLREPWQSLRRMPERAVRGVGGVHRRAERQSSPWRRLYWARAGPSPELAWRSVERARVSIAPDDDGHAAGFALCRCAEIRMPASRITGRSAWPWRRSPGR